MLQSIAVCKACTMQNAANGQDSSSAGRAAADRVAAVDALSTATPVLVGVALRAVERLEQEVSLSQFRVLLALVQLGPSPGARVAAHLAVAGSSVTRAGDRLEASGHLRRCRERPTRSIVRLELTENGRELVGRVVAWRERS